MESVKRRRRGTAIVETDRGILLTAGRHGPFILPGGGARKDEPRLLAALRELHEETYLLPYFAKIIFNYLGKVRLTLSGNHKFQDHHTVCLVKASGIARAGGGDAKRIGYYSPGCDVWVSRTTKEIIIEYYRQKGQNTELNLQAHEEENGGDYEDVDEDDADDLDELGESKPL